MYMYMYVYVWSALHIVMQALLKSSTPTKSEPREQHFPLTASPVDEGDSSDEEYNPTLSSDEEEEEEDGGEEEEGEEEIGRASCRERV